MRLIDADELFGRLAFDFEMLRNGALEKLSSDDILETIHKQPTIDPVKHGHWNVIYTDNKPFSAHCSACNKSHLYFSKQWIGVLPKYCGECGALMDEVSE